MTNLRVKKNNNLYAIDWSEKDKNHFIVVRDREEIEKTLNKKNSKKIINEISIVYPEFLI